MRVHWNRTVLDDLGRSLKIESHIRNEDVIHDVEMDQITCSSNLGNLGVKVCEICIENTRRDSNIV